MERTGIAGSAELADSAVRAGSGRAAPVRSGRNPEILWGSIGLFLLVTGLLAVLTVPDLLALPGCLFKTATGRPCPTCGATRALWALGAGHPLEALAWNPLLGLLGLGGALYLVYAWLVIAGFVAPIRTGWLTPPMPAALRWLAPMAIGLNWIYLILAGA